MERLNTVVNENRKFYYKLLSNDENLLTKEMAIVAGEKISGLLPFSIITKESGVELRYEISALAKFSDYIKTVNDKRIFCNIILQIINTLYEVNREQLLLGKIIFDIRQVLINVYSSQIYFIYLPIMNYNAGYSFSDFLLIMLKESNIDKNSSFYISYANYVNKKQINLREFKTYIESLEPDVGAVSIDNNQFSTITNYDSNENRKEEQNVGISSVPIDFMSVSTIGTHNTKRLG